MTTDDSLKTKTDYNTATLVKRATELASQLPDNALTVDGSKAREVLPDLLDGVESLFDLYGQITKLKPEDMERFVLDFFAIFPSGEELGGLIYALLTTDLCRPTKHYIFRDLGTHRAKIAEASRLSELKTQVTEDVTYANAACISDIWKFNVEAWEVTAMRDKKPHTSDYRPVEDAAVNAAYTAADYSVVGFRLVIFEQTFPQNFLDMVNQRIIEDFMRYAKQGARWMMAQQANPEKPSLNPFKVLVEVYNLGLWPAGMYTNKLDQTKFVVWQPPLDQE